jgi:drug/metabolite transporter (DMT)-like permease
LLAALFWRKMVQPAAIVGVLLATAGLALLSLNADLSVNRGDLLVLGCSVALALQILTTSVFAPRSDPIRLTAVQLLTVAVLSGLFALLWERPLALPSSSVWFAAAFTGLLASSFAFGAQTVAQRFTSATHTALIFVTEPVFAALFSYVMGREALTTRAWLGCGLILAGMLTAELGQPLLHEAAKDAKEKTSHVRQRYHHRRTARQRAAFRRRAGLGAVPQSQGPQRLAVHRGC